MEGIAAIAAVGVLAMVVLGASGTVPPWFEAGLPARGAPYARAFWAGALKLSGLLNLDAGAWGAVLYGIADRESLCGQAFKPPGPKGTGDGGKAHGIFQVHEAYWPEILRDPYNPTHGAVTAAHVLRETAKQLRHYLRREPVLRELLCAYNAGAQRVAERVLRGEDPNLATTGRDYGDDVLRRAGEVRTDRTGVA